LIIHKSLIFNCYCLLYKLDFYNEIIKFTDVKDQDKLSELKDISFEKLYNPFFRIDELSFLDLLKNKEDFQNLNIEERFKLLREMRDEF